MSEDSGSGGMGCCGVIVVVLIILGCVGLGPCHCLESDCLGPTITDLVEE